MALPMTSQSAPTTSSLVVAAGAADGDSASKFDIKRWLSIGKNEPETIAYLNSLYERSKAQRWRFDRQWYVNLSYYFGRQWVNWLNGTSPELARLHEPMAPPWRVRLTVNRIKPAIRREMSKVIKEKPTAFVIPASSDDNDIAAARAGEAIFEHLWRTMEMSQDMWLSQFWRCVTGTGFIKDWWSPNPQPDSNGQIETEVVTPFHLYFSNLDQPRLERQEYIIHVAMKSPDALKAMYQVDVKPDTTEVGGGVIESQYLQALNLEPGKVSQVTVKEIWLKPCTRYPAGAMFVWAGSTILYSSVDAMGEPTWPLASKEYPFTKFDGVPTGRFYGDSSIIDLLPLQKEYNRTRSQIIESKNQMSKPQLIAPRGSIDANKITSEPGLVIFYTPGFNPPTSLPLTPLPNYVLQELDRSLMDMADISGQHDVSNGTVPTGVSAASALSFLQEQDDTMMAPIIASMEAGIERIGRHFLMHAQNWWDEPRAVKVLGADNTWEIQQFKKSDLRGNSDLNIQAGSAMPRSLAAKQAFIMELAKMQLITPEQTLKYLEMAETGRMYEETQTDQRQAMRENMKMSDPSTVMSQLSAPDMMGGGMGGPPMSGPAGLPEVSGTQPQMPGIGAPPVPDPSGTGGAPADPMAAGMPQPGMPQPGMPAGPPPMQPPVIPVNTWDNHQVHIETHNNFRKRQEFENLPPELKMEFERHVALHRAALGLPPEINPEQMQQVLALQQQMGQQAPPQPGGQIPGAAPSNDPAAAQPGAPSSAQPQTAPMPDFNIH